MESHRSLTTTATRSGIRDLPSPRGSTSPPTPVAVKVGVWSTEEHERYLQAKYANPKASWKEIARLVGTRSARQVILHDQKFRAKMERRRSKSERAKTPSVPVSASHDEGLRYFDSMGVLLLASVASSRIPKPQEGMKEMEVPTHISPDSGNYKRNE